jgi:peptide deformylase
MSAKELDELQTKMEIALDSYGGLGLSANQLGIDKRVCLIRVREHTLFLLNPVITERSQEGFIFYEGCLSIPKTIETPLRTIRSTKIKVKTDNLGELEFQINPNGDKEQVSDETLLTVVVQHEIDHLDGITIKDRVYSTTITKSESYGRNDKILMKSPENEFVEVKYKKANEYYLKGYEIV